jgi:hypothetical protein
MLTIVSYRQMSRDATNKALQAPQESNLGVQRLDTGESSKPLPPNTSFVCLFAHEDCSVSFGGAAVPVFAGERLYFGATAGNIISAA